MPLKLTKREQPSPRSTKLSTSWTGRKRPRFCKKRPLQIKSQAQTADALQSPDKVIAAAFVPSAREVDEAGGASVEISDALKKSDMILQQVGAGVDDLISPRESPNASSDSDTLLVADLSHRDRDAIQICARDNCFRFQKHPVSRRHCCQPRLLQSPSRMSAICLLRCARHS